MTSAQLSIETAPRNLEELKKIGRFNLRSLATLLGVFENEANKAAFMQLTNDQQAENILTLLQAKDGTGKATSGKGVTTRSPSTKNAGKPATAAGSATKAETPGTGAVQGGAAGAPVGAGAEKLLAAINGLKEKYESVQGTLASLIERVGVLENISSGTNRFVALSIGLNLKLAEQVLGASPNNVLDVVLEDMPIVEKAMARMGAAGSEAGDEAEGEDEEEGDEGNEE